MVKYCQGQVWRHQKENDVEESSSKKATKIKRFIAFSGGVESTTMCILYGKGATAVFTDTGSEHAEMYRRIEKEKSSV